MKYFWIFFWLFCGSSVVKAQEQLTVLFSQQTGKYKEAIRVELSAEIGSKIYYTTDGTRPNSNSTPYQNSIYIEKTTVLRAIAYKNGKRGRIITRTYLIKESTNFPIVSLAIQPEILFDQNTGWFNLGPNADTEYPYLNANFWSRKEVGANIEIIESDGTPIFNSRVGVRLFGGMSRIFPQKSFAIACRDAYGERRIRHQIFPNKKQDSFKHLVLRNAGSDWGKAHSRDAIITGLLDDVKMAKQAYRPALLFINGMYWGIYNIREKVNRHYIDYEFGVDKDSIDLIEHQRSVKHGSVQHYDQMLAFMSNNNLSNSSNYQYVRTLMDVDNFMTYQITQIFVDNQDGGGNIKFWRPQTASGRWSWILYDTDWGFGLQDENAFTNNSLDFYTEPNGPAWPNPPWSTFILRKLLENDDFKQAFIIRFADYLNTIFASEQVNDRIDSTYRMLKPEMSRHVERWNLKYANWLKHIERMRAFADQRPDYMRNFLQQKFKLGDLVSVKIDVSEGGSINLNDNIDWKKPVFFGQYFRGLPIKIKAYPLRGYEFSHWEGIDAVVTQEELILDLEQNAYTLKAVFKKSKNNLFDKVIINEIAANNKKAGDWIELYNATNQPVNIKNWLLRDAKHDFILPEAIIPPKDYLIICQSAEAFNRVHPKVKNVIGDFTFGLSKTDEKLELYTDRNAPIDTVYYKLDKIQEVFTLSLVHPSAYNNTLVNWEIIDGIGTPGLPNPSYQAYLKTAKKRQTIWYGLGFGFLLLGAMAVFLYKKKQVG